MIELISVEETKACNLCLVRKPTTEFSPRIYPRSVGLKAWCKECVNANVSIQRGKDIAIELALTEKQCSLCHDVLPIELFWKKGNGLRRSECHTCWSKRKKQLHENKIIRASGGETQVCIQCGIEKLKDEFCNVANALSGKSGTCKDCGHKRQREYDKRLREERLVNDRFCPGCSSVKKEIEFETSNRALANACKSCRKIESARKTAEKHATPEWIEAKKAKQSAWDRKRQLSLYGLTEESFQEILKNQDGKCAACGTREPLGKYNQWAVDHCHYTNTVRGLLCDWCNKMEHVGLERARKLVAYMEKFELLYNNIRNEGKKYKRRRGKKENPEETALLL